jgi:DNA-binding MarR family transcriptional regulator
MGLTVDRSVEDAFILTLFDLVNHLTKNGERIVQPEGLTVQQWLLMLQIAGDPNFPWPDGGDGPIVLASSIASARGVSRPSVSSLVTILVHKGLLAQDEDPTDRRQKTLRVTEAGLDVLRRIEPRRRRANDALLAGFEQDELARALDVLNRCLTALRALRPTADGSDDRRIA